MAGGCAPAARRGTLHPNRTTALTHGAYTDFRPSPAPRGSRFLRKLAPCGRGGCAAPLAALGGQSKFCAWLTQGAAPLQPKPPCVSALLQTKYK